MSKKPIDPAVIREFVSTVRGLSSKSIDAKRYLTGTVTHTDPDGTVWVSVAGGVGAMPVTRSTASYSPGDVVGFSIEDGVASMGGNVTDPAAGGDKVINVTKHVNLVENQLTVTQNIVAGKAEIADLNAARATIGELQAADVTITGKLTAAEGDITNLKAKDVEIEGTLTAANAKIGTLESDNVTVKGRLDAAEADIDDLEADNITVNQKITAAEGEITTLKSTKANISDLEANYITAATIEAQYMHANMSNSDVAWISNGVIANGAISSAMINDVSANKLTAGTINGSVINVTNLNADNITAGTINGQRIGEGSLSLDKLSEDVYTEAEVDAKLDTMQAEIDGAIETWTGTTVPTLNNFPASNWTDAATRHTHVGDVYFNTDTGYNYRFTETGTYPNATYSWLQIKDTDITNALQRIQTAEGKITTFDSDISTLKTDTGTLTTKTTSLETRMSDAESDILDKVDTTTFNEVSDTVDSHSESISQMTQTLSNKADSSTVTALTTRVNKTETDISGINTTIGELQTTVASKADGSAVETISSKLNTVSDTVDGHTQTISSVQGVAENANNKAVAYSATSSTGSTTAAKVAACTNFPALAAGVTVTVRFSNSSTATGALTLNVNSTGAKTIYVNGSATSSSNQLLWAANANVTFTYDGTYWRVDSEPRSWYGTCSIAAGTAAKTSAIAEAVVCKGTNVTLNMTYENTSTSATLNVASTGAKNIYYGTTTTRPTTANGYGWTSASTVTFVFDGAYWRLGDTSALAGLASVKSTVTEHTTSIQQNAEAIQTKASASDLNALTGRVSTAESTITQQAGQIEAKVSKDGVIAAINLSSEDATISADKVNITGTAIFSALGSSNKVVTATQTQWYSSTSATTKSGGSWGTTQPSVVAGRYIWQREYITYSDGSHEYKPSEAGVCVQGQTDLSAYSTTAQANALYDSAGSASAAQAAAISAAASDATSKANAAEQNAKTDTANKLTAYSTTSQMNEAIENATGPLFYGKAYSTGYIHLGYAPYTVTSTSNYSHLHLTGRIGGWLSTTSGSIDITFKSRNNNASYNTVDRKDDSVDTSLVDVLVYTGSDNYTHYWLKVNDYWYAQLYAEYEQFTEADHTLTATEPDGTCVWKLSEHTSVAAPKTSAVAETQRVYYRSKVSGTVTSPGTTWVTANGNVWNDTATVGVNGWTTKVTPMSKDKTSNTDANKYLYLYTAIQKKTVSGSVTTTTVLLDDSTTIIDGGNIITGSVTANQLSANSVTADKIAANAITIGKMPSADQASILNSNVTISDVNGLQTELSNKETAGAAAAVQQTLEASIDEVAQDVQNKADNASLDSTNDDLTQLVAGLSTSDHFNVNDDGSYTFGLDDALDGVERKAAQDLSESETALNTKIDTNVTLLRNEIADASQANLYMHFDEASDGLEIGKNLDGTAGAFRQLMDDQGTHWQYNREDAAYVGVNDEGKGTMFLDEAQVTGRLRVGNYIFMGNDAGTRMSLKWIGD